MGTRFSISHKPLATLAAAALAAAVAVVLSMSLGTSKAWAGGQPDAPSLEDLTGKSYTVSSKGNSGDEIRSYQSLKSSHKKLSNAKSSNTKVAKVKIWHHKFQGKNYYSLAVTIKKTGTTKISFKWGSKKYTVKYTVKKYVNPVKTFKVGSKNYASYYAPAKQKYNSEFAGAMIAKNSFSGKVNIKPAKGWKISKIWYYTNDKLKFAKNGAKVSKAQFIYVSLKKGKQKERLQLFASKSYRAA